MPRFKIMPLLLFTCLASIRSASMWTIKESDQVFAQHSLKYNTEGSLMQTLILNLELLRVCANGSFQHLITQFHTHLKR